jgi:hypothetical protein
MADLIQVLLRGGSRGQAANDESIRAKYRGQLILLSGDVKPLVQKHGGRGFSIPGCISGRWSR